ncbi:helix-turn-helix transcriptional regulator [Microbacterium testaceum]|uniref:helix-turn-helix transcriptional regulator n=1 Tax=Microbacterium testaceum TaxID=2033 RepID=UPI002AC778A7|nr:LuxR C-terminal-related transcriptional regulator [Microbacterium testaceum]MDZ5145663.1 LuxR C-terminal-related transcriptional regulator [Microbacterium testaceum]
MSRNEFFLTAVDTLQGGRSLEILGDHGSGRTHLLQRLREHFVTLGWKVVEITGVEAFRRAQLVALALAGIGEKASDARSSPLIAAYRSLSEEVRKDRTVILIDDSDSLDEGSWGVINSVSTQQGVPVAYARLTHRSPHTAVHPTSGFSAVYSIELLPLPYAELQSALESLMSVSIDANTMSRLFAKSGGNIGIASVIFDAAVRAGRIVVDDGTARAVGSLWLPALRAIVDVILQPLGRDDISALKVLSILGPVDIETATKVVSEEQIIRLEQQRYVSVVTSAERRAVTVSPPLLIEYFRHETQPAQRAQLMSKIDHSFVQETTGSFGEDESRDSPARIRLIHERIRLRTLRAREAWATHPTIRHATELLLALQADSTHMTDEISALLSAVQTLEANDRDRADWEIAYCSHIARHHGRLEEAVASLNATAQAIPAEALRLVASALVLRFSLSDVPDREPFAGTDLDELPPQSRSLVLLVRVSWSLITGDTVRADELLTHYDPSGAPVPELDALVVYCQLSMDNYELASRIAETRLREAHTDFAAARIRIYSFLTALCALASRRLDQADATVSEAASLGLPPGESPLSYIGLTLFGAYFAVKRGQRTLMAQYLAELDETGLPDGTLPGQNRAFVNARLSLLEGDSESAARICREAGDELWSRGARLAAAHSYLDGIHANLSKDDWAHARPRIALLNSPALTRTASFYEDLLAGELDAAMSAIDQLESSGRGGEAVYFAHAALRVFTGTDARTSAARERLAHITKSAPNAVIGSGFPELTSREREVAELVASGLTNPLIAEALVVSVRTVESHVNKLMKKIGAKRRQDVREYLLSTSAH